MLLLVAVEHVDSNPPLVGKRSSHVHVCELLNVPSILLQLLAMGSSLTRILPMVPQLMLQSYVYRNPIYCSSKDMIMRAGESLQNRNLKKV